MYDNYIVVMHESVLILRKCMLKFLEVDSECLQCISNGSQKNDTYTKNKEKMANNFESSEEHTVILLTFISI